MLADVFEGQKLQIYNPYENTRDYFPMVTNILVLFDWEFLAFLQRRISKTLDGLALANRYYAAASR